ncbi:MAG: glycosyltransferase [Bryobacteraceae bacterium]
MRIAQIVGGTSIGEYQTLLRDLIRYVNPREKSSVRLDFIVAADGPCSLVNEIRDLGYDARVCPPDTDPVRFAWRLRKILRERGPYDVVHNHLSRVDRLVLWLAARARVPVRISSDPARLASFSGLDFTAFEASVDRDSTRARLGLPDGAFVIGQVLPFEKNADPSFALQLAYESAWIDPYAFFVWIGNGPAMNRMQAMVQHAKLADRVRFVGDRAVASSQAAARLMLGAMDAFVMPEWGSGLGIPLLQAQAAGLPCVISEEIPPEFGVLESLIYRLSPNLNPGAWAHELQRAKADGYGLNRHYTAAVMRASRFNIDFAGRDLLRHYAALHSAAAMIEGKSGSRVRYRAGDFVPAH